jgi:sigma-54 dependent transcriptional regulator, flagellar regulatory protein
MADTPIIVIENDPDTARQICDVLTYLDLPSQAVTVDANWGNLLDGQHPAHLIVLGDCGSVEARRLTFRQVKALDAYAPLVLLDLPEQDAAQLADIESGVLAHVRMPLRHAQFEKVLQKVDTYRENRHQVGSPRNPELFRNLAGSSTGIQRVRSMIEMVAKSDANVLITGESGTGKEVVARHIHHHSVRRSKPFVPLNCGAIPPDLLESELFGHEKGAFTGAISSRQGRFR